MSSGHGPGASGAKPRALVLGKLSARRARSSPHRRKSCIRSGGELRSCTRSQFLASRTITSSLAPLSRSACACEHGQFTARRARAPHASRAGIAPRRATSLRSQANLIFTRRGDALSGSPGSQQARTMILSSPPPSQHPIAPSACAAPRRGAFSSRLVGKQARSPTLARAIKLTAAILPSRFVHAALRWGRTRRRSIV